MKICESILFQLFKNIFTISIYDLLSVFPIWRHSRNETHYEWLVFFVKGVLRTDLPNLSELERPGKLLCFSNGIEDVFIFAGDVFHIFEVFNILDIDGLSKLSCWSNPMWLIGMKLFLLEVHADLASNRILVLMDFERLSCCNSSEDFLDEYPSDDVSSNESYWSLVVFIWSICIS